MEVVNIQEAGKRLSQLVEKAASGEDVVITRDGIPLARITKLEAPKYGIKFGLLAGKLTIAADFGAALSNEAIKEFAGG